MIIIAIGYYAPHNELVEFTEQWEKEGIRVIRVATDAVNKSDLPKNVDISIYDIYCKLGGLDKIWEIEQGIQRVYFEGIATEILYTMENVDFNDAIAFVQQSNDLVLDFDGDNIPVYYNHTQVLKPRIPLNANLRGVISAYPGGIKYLEDIHNGQMIHVEATKFIPHGIPKVFLDSGKGLRDREHLIGFKGSRNQGRKNDPNWFIRNIYKKRRKYLDELKVSGEFIEQAPGSTEKYIEFMHNVKVAINIPAIPGFTNQRQFHAMALGCILFQYDYPGLKEMGFKDLENCILFNSSDFFFKYNCFRGNTGSKVYSYIRDHGIKFAQTQTFAHRAKVIHGFIKETELLVESKGTRWVRHADHIKYLKETGQY